MADLIARGIANKRPSIVVKNVPIPSNQLLDPLNLHFKIVRRQKTVSPWAVGDHLICEDDFYSNYDPRKQYRIRENASDTGTVSAANGKIIFTANSGKTYNVYAKTFAPMKIPHIVVRGTVVQRDSGSVEVGLFDENGWNHIFADYDGVNVRLCTRNNSGVPAVLTTTPLTMTPPFDIRFIIAYPTITVYVDKGEGLQPVATAALNTTAFPMTLPSDISKWAPYFGATGIAGGQTVAFTYFSVGYVGGLGFRDPKLVTYTDGTPVVMRGKYLISFTVAATGNTYRANHWAVGSFDPNTYNIELLSHLFFKVPSGEITSLYPGQILYDEVKDEWILVNSSWGLIGGTSQGTVMPLYLSLTDSDITTGVHFLDAIQMNVPASNNLLWDPAIRKGSDGKWKLVVGDSDGVTGCHPVLLESADLINGWTQLAQITSHYAEGFQWFKVGGQWYIAGAQFSPTSGWSLYDKNLNYLGLTPNWRAGTSLAAVDVSSSTPWPHPCVLPISENGRTRYIMITFDRTNILGDKASGGGPLILEADETVDGYEFPRKRLIR